MSWWTYVARVADADSGSPKAMQTRTGIDAPHFSKWKSGTIPGPGLAAQFARGYNQPVLEAFVAAGFLTEAEAKVRPAAAPSLDSLTDEELVEEILRRMRRGGEDGGDTAATKTPFGALNMSADAARVRENMAARRALSRVAQLLLAGHPEEQLGEVLRELQQVDDDDELAAFVEQAVRDLSSPEVGNKAARQGTSRGRQIRDALEVVGEESQGEAPEGGA